MVNQIVKPLVSVVVPVYNVEEYVGHCIDSIINQSYENIEIIIVNDGSTDSSPLICEQYGEMKNIKVIHQANQGLSSARNAGLHVAKGEFITFIDSDDWISSTMIEECVGLLLKNNASACGVAFMKAYPNGHMEQVESVTDETAVYSKERALSLYLYNTNLNVCVCGKVWRSEVWKGIECPRGLLHEDQYTTHRLLEACESVVFLPAPLYYYRQRAGSIGHSAFSERSYDLLRGIDQQYETITKMHPGIRDELGSACSFWYCVFSNMMIKSGYRDDAARKKCRDFVRANLKNILRTRWYTKVRKAQLILFALNDTLYEFIYDRYLRGGEPIN